MQLYEAGKLDLEAPVQRYVPSFPRKPWPITVRQLLGHLGGIRHYASPDEVNSTRYFPDLLAPLRLFQNDPLVAEPGTGFHYTTYGYVLLGAAVEAASAQRFMDYLRQRVFAPAGMDRIRQDHVFAVIPNRARGYTLGPSGQLQNCALADTSNKVPGGGLVSTVEDLARFATAMRKGVLLRPHTVDMMFTPQRLKDGKPTDYGLGWQVRSIESVKVVQHTGGQQGVSTILALQPRENVAVALMSNLERAQLQDLAHRILRLLAESPTGARQKSNFDQRPGLAAGR
jgi:CubicO group peptidase (beta-lactamase class C family)